MWAVVRVAYYHSDWDMTHLVEVKLYTFTLASRRSNCSRTAATGGWSHAMACLFPPLEEAEGWSPCREPPSFHSSCSATRRLFLMYHSITALCQALLEAPGILQGAQQTTTLLFWDLYFIREIESINNKQGG